jgi:hypothetical protein
MKSIFMSARISWTINYIHIHSNVERNVVLRWRMLKSAVTEEDAVKFEIAQT